MPDLTSVEMSNFGLELSGLKPTEKPIEKPPVEQKKPISERARSLVNKIAFWKKSTPNPNPDIVFKEIADLPLEQPEQAVQVEPLPVPAQEVPVEVPVEVPAEIPVQVKPTDVQEVPEAPKVEPTVIVNPERSDRLKTNDVLEQLKPEKTEDDEGNERTVFTFTNKNGAPVKVVFYSPDELPYTAGVITGREAFIYGEKPQNRSSEEWQVFIDKTKNGSKSNYSPVDSDPMVLNEAINSGTGTLFVEATPQHLLDLAFTLGKEDKDLQEGRDQATHKKLTPQVTAIIDRIIAGKIIDDTGELNVETNYNGEALAIQSLMGDKKAQEILEEKWKILQGKNKQQEEADQEVAKQLFGEGEKVDTNSERLTLEDLVAVHRTNYMPTKNTNGQYEMKTTFDATDWSTPRITTHFALNHPVQENSGGDWTYMRITSISRLDKMIDVNGKPYILNPVDTSFETSPGDTLKLPEGTIIIHPGKIESGKLYEKQGNEIVFKTENYTPQEVTIIVGDGKNNVNQKINEQIDNLWRVNAKIDTSDYALFNKITSNQRTDVLAVDFVELLEHQSMSEVIDRMMEISDQILLQAGKNKMSEGDKTKLTQIIQGTFTAKLQEDITRQTIRELGFKDQPGGSWSWGGAIDYRVDKLATKLGVKRGSHGSDISSDIEKSVGVIKKVIAQPEKPEKMEKYNELRDQLKTDDLSSASQKSKRMMYLMGVI